MKYKLWCKNKNEWEKDSWLITSNGDVVWEKGGGIIDYCNMKNHILIRSTGIKDINEQEIFEGDILKCKLYNSKYENYIIIWDKDDASFDALNKDKSNFMCSTIWNQFEIVGNIFENPELLL